MLRFQTQDANTTTLDIVNPLTHPAKSYINLSNTFQSHLIFLNHVSDTRTGFLFDL